MKILLLLLSLVAAVSCQFLPTPEQEMCIENFFTNNPTDTRVFELLAACANVPDFFNNPDPLAICADENCVDANQAITLPECGYDFKRSKSRYLAAVAS